MSEAKNFLLNRRDFLTLTGSSLLLAACGQQAEPAPVEEGPLEEAPVEEAPGEEAAGGGTLRVAFSSTPAELDPALYTNNEEYNIGFAIFDGLVWVDHTLTPQPALAESWESSDDGLTWTFKLREGVKFHHGTDFTAQDVVYTFERILDEEFGSPLRSTLLFLDGVEAVDDYTVQFNLASANADLPFLTGGAQARIVPHDMTSDEIRANPSGTGAFKMSEYVAADHTTLVRNDDYWGGAPALDEIRHLYMPEAPTQVAALSGGTIDVIWQLGPENIPPLEGDPNVTVHEVPSGLYQTIAMQANVEPFTDVRVRQALKYCVDRPGVLQVVLQGRGELANDHPIAPVSPFYADIPIRERNIEKAKELLAEAGYPDGLELTLVTSSVRAGMVEFAVAFQEMAKEAGIKIEIERVPPDNFWSETWMKVPFFTSNWNFRPSIDETLTLLYHSDAKWNEGEWRNPDFDALVEAARAERDPDKRKELYAQAQELLHEEGSVIISYFKPALMAIRNNVKGFTPHPATWLDFRSTSLEA